MSLFFIYFKKYANHFLFLFPYAFFILLGFYPYYNFAQSSTQNKLDFQTFEQLATTEARMNFFNLTDIRKIDKTTFDAFLPIIQKKEDIRSLIYWHYLKAFYKGIFNDTDTEVVENYQIMFNLAQKHNFLIEILVAQNCLNINKFTHKELSEQQMYPLQLNTFEEMKKLGIENFKPYHASFMLWRMGRTFYDVGDTEKAFESLFLAEKKMQPNTEYFHVITLNLLETLYSDRKDYPNAIMYAQKVNELSSKSNSSLKYAWRDAFWQGLAYLNIASYLLEMGKWKECEEYANQGYVLCKLEYDVKKAYSQADNGHIIFAEYDALQVILKIKLRLGKVQEAEVLLKRVEEIMSYLKFDDAGNYFKIMPLYRNYANYYKIKGKYDKAFFYMELANEMQDSLNGRNDIRKLWQTKIKVEAEKYQLQIKLAEEESHLQVLLRNIALFFVIFVVFVAFWIYNRIKKDNKIISNQKGLLEKSLSEKEMLLKEVHHRVKNNLQIISALFDRQARQATDEMMRKLMREGQNRVFSISLVHQNLYQSENLATTEVKPYLEMLILNIEKSQIADNQGIKVALNVDNSVLGIDTIIPLGLILNELVTNCYKYAFKGRENGQIKIEFCEKEKEYFVQVQDNGVGMSPNFDLKTSKSLGLNLVKGLVRQLRGKLHFESNAAGTVIHFSIRK